MAAAGEAEARGAGDVMQRRIRRSALLLIAALAGEIVSLFWRSPLSFFFFLGWSGILALLGMGSFLLSLVSSEARKEL